MLLTLALSALVVSPLVAMVTTSKAKKVGAPKKSSSPMKKKTVSLGSISTNQERKPTYTLKILKLKPDFELIWAEKSPGNDAYMQPIFKNIEETSEWEEHGVIMVSRRRISLDDNSALVNTENSYFRKCIVRNVTEESTPDTRRTFLNLIREFVMRNEHNRYGYDYQINENSDLTPLTKEALENADNYLPDAIIVNIVLAIYEGTGGTWYEENQEYAESLFTGPTYPEYAVKSLGYPANTGGDGAFHNHFNQVHET